MAGPNANGFASQWNIGLRIHEFRWSPGDDHKKSGYVITSTQELLNLTVKVKRDCQS